MKFIRKTNSAASSSHRHGAPSMASGLMSGVGSGMSADAISKTTTGMNDMSGSIASSGGGTGVGKMMQGISTAMSKATGNPLPEPKENNKGIK